MMVSNFDTELQKQGWRLSIAVIEEQFGGESNLPTRVDDLIKDLLNLDLNSFEASCDSEGTSTSKVKADVLNGPLVLQVQKVRNVSAPKANESSQTAPQLLKVTVTDGNANYQVLQMGNWNTINLETPPGTKLQLKSGQSCRVHCGFLPLSQNQFSILGGTVPGLVEKWQMTKVPGLRSRHRDGGAPKWVPFGHALITNDNKEKSANFKSLEPDAKQVKENEAFDQQRNANIAEIAKTINVQKKDLGKGKPPYEERLQEKFQERFRGNPRSRGRSEGRGRSFGPGRNESDSNRPRFERRGNSRREERDDGEMHCQPSKPSTLFDFLTNKLSDGDVPTTGSLLDGVKQFGKEETDGSNRRYNRNDYGDEGKSRHNFDHPRGSHRGNFSANQTGQYQRHDSNRKPEPPLQAGDKVLAKYWEDHKMHRAVITAPCESGRTCVVQFVDYDNYEEVLVADIQRCAPHKWENLRPGVAVAEADIPSYQRRNDQADYGHYRNDSFGRGQYSSGARGGRQANFDKGHRSNEGYVKGQQESTGQGRNEYPIPVQRGGPAPRRNDGDRSDSGRGRQRNDRGDHGGQRWDENQDGGGRPYREPNPRAFNAEGDARANFTGSFEFRRGSNRPSYQSGRGRGGQSDRGRSSGRPSYHNQGGRPERQFYQPPRQRREDAP